MVRAKVLAGTALVGVVALAGCSSSASSSASASTSSGSAAASGAANDVFAPPMNDAATGGAANAEFLDTQASSDTVLSLPNAGVPAIVQACNAQSNGTNPVVVINYTGQPQTFNYSDNDNLATFLNFINPSQVPAGFNCTISRTASTPVTSQPVTVPAGQTMVTVLTTGGNDAVNALGSSQHNLSIGGGTSGNTQWYDFYLHMNDTTYAFENWELAYENTGGLNPTQNTQAGLLNVVECSMSSDGTITTGAAVINDTLTTLPQTTIATPYGSNSNRWQYNSGDPICLGFFDQNAPGVTFNPAS